MEIDKKTNNKFSDLNPVDYKSLNINSVNIFDTYLGANKNKENGFKKATKLKRNFK